MPLQQVVPNVSSALKVHMEIKLDKISVGLVRLAFRSTASDSSRVILASLASTQAQEVLLVRAVRQEP
jgi:hypothetical protein